MVPQAQLNFLVQNRAEFLPDYIIMVRTFALAGLHNEESVYLDYIKLYELRADCNIHSNFVYITDVYLIQMETRP